MRRTSTWSMLLVAACAGGAPEAERALIPEEGPDRAGAPASSGDPSGDRTERTGKVDPDAPDASDASDAPDAPDAPEDPTRPALAALPLPQLDLRVDAPRDAEVREALVGEGLTIHAEELNVRVELSGPQTPATLAEARAEAQLFAPTELRETRLSDGWILTFESETAMGPSYWVQLRRDVGGRAIWCTSTSSSEARQLAALDLCSSLRPG